MSESCPVPFRRGTFRVLSSIRLFYICVIPHHIDSATLDACEYSQLTDAEALLCDNLLASRTLAMRSRLGHWDAAVVDAEEVLVALPI